MREKVNKNSKLIHSLQFLVMILSAFVVGFILNLAQTDSFSFTKQIVFETNVNTYLITVAILFLIHLGLYGIFNRFFYASGLFYAFFALYAAADRLKVMYRSEPILPSDLLLLKNVKELLAMVTGRMIIEILIVLIVLVAIFIFLEKHFGKDMLRFKPVLRLVFVALATSSIAIFYTASNENSITYKVLAKSGYTNYASNINQSANSNGPMLTFLGNLYIDVMDQPKDYSKQEMETVLQRYQK